MSDQRRAPAYLDEIRVLLHEVLAADDLSIPAAAIVAALHDHLATEEFATSLYLLWGFLGESEWEQDRAADAAREWLALDHADRAAVRGYYDHWLFDVCGYQRP
ncbi:hypothetical protein Aab01nite_37350 [Paractinoplanes abujensis]|uniref:Uncharacterized protein n=1 Tax=Paractinoplanes abujensis TaxID=882441 RepID=A0A7W7CX48_9ACTN|nr:hypothetical protein [Actinoplanes abujensis]MBB4694641.1 hypothetical protein [Actinoplanes abujensis]GID20145.1 hypothetical protein Aab01nite_37350 [Actinoplanes abujensis]